MWWWAKKLYSSFASSLYVMWRNLWFINESFWVQAKKNYITLFQDYFIWFCLNIFNMLSLFEYTRLLTTYIKMQPSPNGKSNNEPDAILTFIKWYFYPKYGKMDTAISFKNLCVQKFEVWKMHFNFFLKNIRYASILVIIQMPIIFQRMFKIDHISLLSDSKFQTLQNF